MNYIYRFDIAALIVSISILISLIRNKTIRTRMVLVFEVWFITIIFSCVFDVAAILFLNNPERIPLWAHYFVNIAYHICFMFIPQVFCYVIYFSTEETKVPSFLFRFLFNIPYLIAFVFVLTTPLTHCFFYFDKNLVYHRGSLFFVSYASAGFYLLSCAYRSIRYKQHFSSYQFFSVCFFMILSVLTLTIQYFFPRLMLMNFTISVSSMIGYLSLENPSDYIDKEMPMYNRNGFIEYMNQYLFKQKKLTLLGLQIVDFKAMENEIGSKNKLSLLQQLGNDMLYISPMNKNFRISQSRFVILLNEDEITQKNQIKQIIDYSLKAFKVGDTNLLIPVNSVLIKCPEDAQSVDDILELVEHSCNKILTTNNSLVPRADKNILVKRAEVQKLLEQIKSSVNSGDFEVFYQPLYDLNLKRYTNAEALIRVKTKENIYISPQEFLSNTEKSGILVKLDEYTLDAACKFIIDYEPYEHGIDFLVIKLSVLQCMQENLYENIMEVLKLYQINPKYIRFEISESSTLLAKDVLLANMEELHKQGFVFILTDYGTGLSNVANIVKFPFSAIKIDKEIIEQAANNKKASIILKENLSMVKDMNLQIIADCVEKESINQLIVDSGCDFLQGYNCLLPLNTKDFVNMILS